MPLRTDRFLVLGTSFALVSCGMIEWPGRAEDRAPPRAAATSASSEAAIDLGDPYTISGVEYRPMDNRTLDETGYAGLSNDLDGVSIAHKTLPVSSYVELTALGSGRTILARVIERGPMSNARLVDLSCAAASQLGLSGQAPIPIRVRRIRPTPPDAGALDRGDKAAERLPAPKPMLAALTKKLPPVPKDATMGDPCAEIPPASPPIATARPVAPAPAAPAPAKPSAEPNPAQPSDFIVEEEGASPKPPKKSPAAPRAASAAPHSGGGFAVQAGAFSSQAKADAFARRIDGFVERAGNLYRVRSGPYPDRAAAAKALSAARAKGFADARIVLMDGR